MTYDESLMIVMHICLGLMICDPALLLHFAGTGLKLLFLFLLSQIQVVGHFTPIRLT